ncbi:MAG: hypothetical protein AAFV33_18740 [Chloroflexota bacterium]
MSAYGLLAPVFFAGLFLLIFLFGMTPFLAALKRIVQMIKDVF